MVLALDYAGDYLNTGNDIQTIETVNKIAFLDFDGTITSRDTMLDFFIFSGGRARYYGGFLLYSPILILYKLGLVSIQFAKEKILEFFISRYSINEFDQLCQRYVTERLPELLRPKALKEIRLLKEAGFEIVVVSASPENWVGIWCRQLKLRHIATRLSSSNEKFTGRIEGENCRGIEKVNRINKEYKLDEYMAIYSYGDTKGDKPMLELATRAFYKPFR